MLFHSKAFLAFFLIVYPVYLSLKHRHQNLFLLAASYFFYGYWNWRMAFLMLLTSAVDYFLALRIELAADQRQRLLFLRISIAVNLLVLGTFKYFDFFTGSFSALLDRLGIPADPMMLNIILPAGISFYTFQAMSYVIDVYRRDIRAEKDFANFALFVCFFPQLIAGPIERAKHLLGQIHSLRTISNNSVRSGCLHFLLGYFQKTFLADGLNPLVRGVFDSTETVSGLLILLGSMTYAIEIYCDFAGYSNMARGLASLMGFELMKNFFFPFFSENPRQMWARWHISLSSWFRDYLYKPLRGLKRGRLHAARNVMIVMGLCGLWHGAGWNFILWGLYQGVLIILYQLIPGHGERSMNQATRSSQDLFLRPARIILFFLLWSLGLIFFRSHSLSQATLFWKTLFQFDRFWDPLGAAWLIPLSFFWSAFWLLEGTLWAYRHKSNARAAFSSPFWLAGILVFSAYLILFFGPQNESVFIYFQF